MRQFSSLCDLCRDIIQLWKYFDFVSQCWVILRTDSCWIGILIKLDDQFFHRFSKNIDFETHNFILLWNTALEFPFFPTSLSWCIKRNFPNFPQPVLSGYWFDVLFFSIAKERYFTWTYRWIKFGSHLAFKSLRKCHSRNNGVLFLLFFWNVYSRFYFLSLFSYLAAFNSPPFTVNHKLCCMMDKVA